jgi:hypothetical protein
MRKEKQRSGLNLSCNARLIIMGDIHKEYRKFTQCWNNQLENEGTSSVLLMTIRQNSPNNQSDRTYCSTRAIEGNHEDCQEKSETSGSRLSGAMPYRERAGPPPSPLPPLPLSNKNNPSDHGQDGNESKEGSNRTNRAHTSITRSGNLRQVRQASTAEKKRESYL